MPKITTLILIVRDILLVPFRVIGVWIEKLKGKARGKNEKKFRGRDRFKFSWTTTETEPLENLTALS